MFDIKFTEAGHTYTLDGEPVPSVTRVIERLYDFRFVKQADLDRASDLGRKVHRTIHLAETGRLDESKLHPTLAKYLFQWREFKKFMKYEPAAFELLVASKKWKYAGQLDTHGILLPQADFDVIEHLLLDIKTGAKYPAHKVQTAGYKIAACEMGLIPDDTKRASVYLSETEFELEWHNQAYDIPCFLSLNTVQYWSKHHGQTRTA